MGALKKFEQRLEGFVNGAFAKVFKSEVQPVEIAGALQRECDNNASIWNRDRTVVPNDFIVELSTHDYERLSPYTTQLGGELAGMVREYAQAQRYSFMGPLKIALEQGEDLETGLYRVRSRIEAGEGPPAADPRAQQMLQQPPQPYSDPQAEGWPPPMPPGPPTTPVFPAVQPARVPGYATGTPEAVTLHRWLEMDGNRHQVTTSTVVLGRSPEADLQVGSPGVSRKHAEIRIGNPSVVVDLGSTNGIVVDGQPAQRAALHDGSQIVLGTTTIVFRQTEA